MQMISKKRALKILKQAITEFPSGNSPDFSFLDYDGWLRSVRVRIEGIFGEGSPQVEEVKPLIKRVLGESTESYRKGYSVALIAYLRSLYAEVNELWSDEGFESPSIMEKQNIPQSPIEPHNSRVFIVHGHDYGRAQAVARFLEHLELLPVILHERPSGGDTIIEKLESNSDASFAVVLLTPDDVGSSVDERDNLHPRARQNVILELGYFLARLGRRRTVALLIQGVEVPSDFSGVLYISIDKGDEWKLLLARELKASGLKIDLNKVI